MRYIGLLDGSSLPVGAEPSQTRKGTGLSSGRWLSFLYPNGWQLPFLKASKAVWKAIVLLRDVDAKFDAQSNSHFNYMWSHLSESEKITLLTVMSLCHQKQSAKTHPTLENLAALHPRAHLDIPELLKRGMLLEDKNKQLYRTLSPSLERWIAREITSAPGEEKSAATVDEWLNAGGRSDLEQVKGVFPKFKKKYWSVIGNLAKDISVDIIKKFSHSDADHGLIRKLELGKQLFGLRSTQLKR